MGNKNIKQFYDINSIITTIVSWPDSIENNVSSEVIIVIPGNPGVPEFYSESLNKIHKLTGLPVWIIGHAGHEILSPEDIAEHNLKINTNDAKYSLDDQLQHKMQFILQFTEATSKIHLVGHSIGAWIVLELLKNDVINSRVASANLLYPTIQRMAIAPYGVVINRIRKVNFILKPLIWLIKMTPVSALSKIMTRFLTLESETPNPKQVNLFINWVNPRVAENVFFMAYDEMDKVTELDIDLLMVNKDKINILYGTKDNWAPKEWFLDLKTKIPSMYMKELPHAHGFTLYETQVEEITAEIIKGKKLQ